MHRMRRMRTRGGGSYLWMGLESLVINVLVSSPDMTYSGIASCSLSNAKNDTHKSLHLVEPAATT